MKHSQPYGHRRRLVRCDGCRQHYDEAQMNPVRRPRAQGTLQLCGACWWDVHQAVRFGGHELDELIEQLAELAPAPAGPAAAP